MLPAAKIHDPTRPTKERPCQLLKFRPKRKERLTAWSPATLAIGPEGQALFAFVSIEANVVDAVPMHS